jgi:hypothetical protein
MEEIIFFQEKQDNRDRGEEREGAAGERKAKEGHAFLLLLGRSWRVEVS